MTARPLPVRPRSAAVGVRALGAMALAMVLASCSLLNGDDRSQEAATAKADPTPAAHVAGVFSCPSPQGR